MTDTEDRKYILDIISEAKENGLNKKLACEALGYDIRTIQRWEKENRVDGRKGSQRYISHKLTDEERQEVIDTVNLPEYRDLCSAEIVAVLAENNEYIGSERTIQRILKQEDMLTHRGPGKKSRVRRERPVLTATAPNQIFSWDITYLRTNIKGIYFYLYLMMDIWSRKIITWEIHTEETSENSAAMLHRLSKEMDLTNIKLHADNGGPMKGATMLEKLYELGMIKSFSRPRVSEDNPYSESLFKTLKYHAGYPKMFESLTSAKNWVADFVHWYNYVHRHSGINYVTPNQRHTGEDKAILAARRETFKKAREATPLRWSGNIKNWAEINTVSLGVKKTA
jgi:putative transposase